MEGVIVPEIALMFVLGLRHGLDPDHLAIVDGLTFATFRAGEKYSRWVGALFAFGHGIAVTTIGLLIHVINKEVLLFSGIWRFTEWLTPALFMTVGAINLKALLSSEPDFKIKGWRTWLIGPKWKRNTGKLGIILIGVVFALVFETITQILALSQSMSSSGGLMVILSLGAAFTIGMMITDTIDGLVLHHIWRSSEGKTRIADYRRIMGWLIVVTSFAVAGYQIITQIYPSIVLSDFIINLISLLFLFLIPTAYAFFLIISKTLKISTNGN